jgi:drug/metabolite transporter (DMT)-like permease
VPSIQDGILSTDNLATGIASNAINFRQRRHICTFRCSTERYDRGTQQTTHVLLFGSLYLLMPAAADGFAIGELSPPLALAALPTILGFFCTTKAIEYLKPSQVQALELTEPLFAALLAFVALNEVPPQSLYAGAALIIVGLCFSNELMRLGGKACAPSTS